MEDFKRKTNNIFGIKETLKNQLNILGAEITSTTTFRAYADWLDTWTDNLYKKIRDKTVLSHNGLYGKTSQNASPTPEYPSEVKTFSGEQTVTIEGTNIFNFESYTDTTSGLTSNISGNNLKVTGTATSTQKYVTNYIQKPFERGKYVFSISNELPLRFILRFYNNGSTMFSFNIMPGQTSTVIDLDEPVEQYRLILNPALDTTYNIDVDVKLEKGEEIENQSFPVSLKSKNIFNSNLKQGGRLFSNGNYFNASNYVHNENPIAIKEGETYTLSANNYSARSEAGFVFFNNGTYVSSLKQQSQTFTAPNGVNQVYCDFYTGSNITPSDITNIQLEKSSEATEYEPFYDIELCDIGGYQDRIYKENGKWYLYKEIGKYVFTDNENWEIFSYGTRSWRLRNILSFNPIDSEILIISNIFEGIKKDDRSQEISNSIYVDNSTQFVLRNTAYSTISTIRDATKGNYVYYVLANPIEETLTEEKYPTLYKQLNDINDYLIKRFIKKEFLAELDKPVIKEED